jgi:hypothetical protein
MIKRFHSLSHTVTGILILVLTLVLFCNPTTAFATLQDEIEIAIQTAIQGMVGTEFGIDSVTFDFYGVTMTMTVMGFALCEPSDPYAPPDPTPVPPLTVYRCENLTTVGADVANDETSADILIEFSKIFLDLQSSRDETALCLLWGDTFPFTGTVAADGYMLGHASVEVGLGLEFVDGCFRASLIPGSTAFTLTPDEMDSRDECLDANMDDILMPTLYPLVEEYLDTVFEATLVILMDEVSDLLCDATPDDYSSWGSVKSIYR